MSRPLLVAGGLLVGLAACDRPAGVVGGVEPVPADDRPPPLAEVGRYRVEQTDGGWRRETKLVADGILLATQINRRYLLPADAPIPFGGFGPWDALLLQGSLWAWDPSLEPLTYHHRTGPVGAMFHELRTRPGGPLAVGVVGLFGGTPAAYARAGDSFTFYERDPVLKKLIADTDRYFTFLADARGRGAAVEVKVGGVRQALRQDAGRKYGLLLVELIDVGFDPGDRLTLEAVRLYADRVAADGLIGLHISNKDYRLEPVVAKIATELGLAARVWNDDAEGRPGKTASSWVALARTEKDLGKLAGTVAEQAEEFVGDANPVLALHKRYGGGAPFTDALDREYGRPTAPAIDLLRRYGAAEPVRRALEKETADGGPGADGPGVVLLRGWARKYTAAADRPDAVTLVEAARLAFGQDFPSLARTAIVLDQTFDPAGRTVDRAVGTQFGPMFHRLKAEAGVGVRRDGDTAGLPPAGRPGR